jgi:hypothetical protein
MSFLSRDNPGCKSADRRLNYHSGLGGPPANNEIKKQRGVGGRMKQVREKS